MPRYKLSPEERAAEKERKENLRNIMKGLDVKNFDDLKDVFKMMVGEMLENGLDGELDDELGYTNFKYPEAVRTLIYTTNTIGGFNRQLRKVTKNKSVFPTDDSLLKMLYLAMIDITKKWTGKRKDWGQIHSQLEIFFADRLPQ